MSGRSGGRTVDSPFPNLLRGSGDVVAAGDRFGARARARRRKVVAAWVVVVLCLLAGGWTLLASPWGTVQKVEVTGVRRVSADEVRAVVAPQVGKPLYLVRTGSVADSVRRLQLVADAEVHQVWPGTLRVDVRERTPVAALPKAGGGYTLVDRDGVEVDSVTAAPVTVPVVEVDLMTAGPAAVRSALDSLGLLPLTLRVDIRRVGAASGDGVWFRLESGDTVVWGDASAIGTKVTALEALRRQTERERAAMRKKGDVALSKRPVTFDVSAPNAPSVQR